MATTGHEDEKISVGGLKASLQKFKNDKVDPIVSNHATTGTTGDYPYNGKGLVTLPKNMVNGVNTLTQAMMPTDTGGNTVYVIRYDYVLSGNVTVPANCVLKFDGGSISGSYTLTGNGTVIDADSITIFGNNVTIKGTWSAKDYLPEWFAGDVEKCLNAFKNVSFVKNTTLTNPITIHDFCTINFKANISVTVDSAFSGNYLFVVDVDDENHYSSEGDVSYKESKVVFNGCGGNTIDLNNRTCFIKQNSSERLQIHSVKVINAAHLSSDTTAIVWGNYETTITDSEFFADRQDISHDPAYGIHLGGTDNRIIGVELVISTIGFNDCHGDSQFMCVHVWGAPNIAFVVTGNVSFNDVYADWARTSFFYSTNVPVNIHSFHFIAPSKNSQNYQNWKFVLIKTAADYGTMRGVFDAVSVYTGNWNCNTFAYGDKSDYTNQQITLYTPTLVSTNIETVYDANAANYPVRKAYSQGLQQIQLGNGKLIKYCYHNYYPKGIAMYLHSYMQTRIKVLITNAYAVGDVSDFKSLSVQFYLVDNYLYIYNNTGTDLYVMFNPLIPREDVGEFKFDGTIYQDTDAFLAAINKSSMSDLTPMTKKTMEGLTFLSGCASSANNEVFDNQKKFLTVFDDSDSKVYLFPSIEKPSSINDYSIVGFEKEVYISSLSDFINLSSIENIDKFHITGEVVFTFYTHAFENKTIIIEDGGSLKTSDSGTINVQGTTILPSFDAVASVANIAGYPAAGTYWKKNGSPVWSTGSDWSSSDGNVIADSAISFSAANTTYVIRQDIDLGGETVTVPAGCTLKFDGGTLSNGTLTASGKLAIVGYGCLCALSNAGNVHFENPYHVSTINGLKTGADGSPNKPFYYIQDALDVCNNIVVERNSVLWVDQVVHNIASGGDYVVAGLKYNTTIGVYGSGAAPTISCYAIINNIKKTEKSSGKWEFDYTNSSLEFPSYLYQYSVRPSNIAASSYPELLNFGLCVDSYYPIRKTNHTSCVKDFATAASLAQSTGMTFCCVETEDTKGIPRGTDYLKRLFTGDNYKNRASLYAEGISCYGKDISISGFNIEYVVHGIAGARGRTSVKGCTFRYIGGHIQNDVYAPRWVQYGNAVESYGSVAASAFMVEHCSFNTVFDTAITIQGVTESHSGLCIHDNNISNARMGLEFFATDSQSQGYNSSFCVDVFNNTIKSCKNTMAYLWYQPDGTGADQTGGFGAIRQGSAGLPNLIIRDNIVIDSVFIFSQADVSNNVCRIINNIIIVKDGEIVLNGYDGLSVRKYADITKPNEILDYIHNNIQNHGNVIHILPSINKQVAALPSFLANSHNGYMAFHNDSAKFWDGAKWVDADGNVIADSAGSFSAANTTYVICQDIDLGGETVTVPAGCTLKFDGGTLSNGTLTGQDTTIDADMVKIFGTGVTIAGTWNVKEVYPQWFGIVPNDNTMDLKPVLLKLLEFNSVIFLKRGTWYMSECLIAGRWHVLIEGENMGYDEETEIRPFTTGQHYILKLGGTADFADVAYSDSVNVRRFRINGIRFYIAEGYELSEAVDGTPCSGALCMQYCAEGYVNVSFFVTKSRALFVSSSWEILFDFVKVYGAYNQTDLSAIYFGKAANDNYSNLSAITFNYLCGENVTSTLIDCAAGSTICPIIFNTIEYEDWSVTETPPRSLVTSSVATIISGIRETEKSYLINVIGWVSFGIIQITMNGAKKYTNTLDAVETEYVRGIIKMNPGEQSKIHVNHIKMADSPYLCIGNFGGNCSELSIDQVSASGYASDYDRYGRVYIDSEHVTPSATFHEDATWYKKSSTVKITKCDSVINPDVIKAYQHLYVDSNNFNEIAPIIQANNAVLPVMYSCEDGSVIEGLQFRYGPTGDMPRKYLIKNQSHLKFVTGMCNQWSDNHLAVKYYKNGTVVKTDNIKFSHSLNGKIVYYYPIYSGDYEYFAFERKGPFVLISLEAINLEKGVTALRPLIVSKGASYYDTSINKPIWYNGSGWVDASGTTV